MDVSVHMGRRYCQRIKGIEEKTSGSYYHQNMELINGEIEKMFEHSDEFYSGKIKQHPSRHYYRHRNVIIVATDDTLVSIFRIAFGGVTEYKVNDILDIMLQEVDDVVLALNETLDNTNKNIQAYENEINEAKENIKKYEKLIEGERAHITANTEYKKVENVAVLKAGWKLNDLMEAIIGKGFTNELQQ